MEQEKISKCCTAPVIIHWVNESTHSYICSACHCGCNLYKPRPKILGNMQAFKVFIVVFCLAAGIIDLLLSEVYTWTAAGYLFLALSALLAYPDRKLEVQIHLPIYRSLCEKNEAVQVKVKKINKQPWKTKK